MPRSWSPSTGSAPPYCRLGTPSRQSRSRPSQRRANDSATRSRECNFEVRGQMHEEDQVLENFVDGAGRLHAIPAQRKKRLAILRWLVEDFQPGRLYAEAEVNRVITQRHPDFAALRRYLVDEELMQRRRGVYWRTGSVPNVGFDPPNWPDLR